MKNTTTKAEEILLRDSLSISPWQKGDFEIKESAAGFSTETIYDALIVGGGITGLTTALLLQQQGKKCVIAEASNVGFGTTGGTSAHLNTFFDATYPEIEKDFGKDAAKLVADCGKESFAMIRKLAKELDADCDLEMKDAYLFSETDKETKQLDEILESSQNAGIKADRSTTINVPLDFQKAIKFNDQGQFHPLKYSYALAKGFVDAGGVIHENTFIKQVSHNGDTHIAESGTLRIQAKNIIYATHIPPGITLLNFRCAPYKSYVLGISLKDDDYPDGLAYDMQEPYHYFRTHVVDGKKQLILGGEDHKTGHDDPQKAFENLENYARQHYNVASIDFKWSSQYYVPTDGLPYIGRMPGGDDNTFVATGYNGNGMMFGTIAGKIISDAILEKENKYAGLFSPSRMKPVADFVEFVKENTDVAYHFVADRFSSEDVESLKDLAKGSGKIVTYKDDTLAVYKDEKGKVHALNPVCTHAKCIVNFNDAEKSWDCPCHGARFDIDGKVLTGPARNDLQKIDLA